MTAGTDQLPPSQCAAPPQRGIRGNLNVNSPLRSGRSSFWVEPANGSRNRAVCKVAAPFS